VHIGVVRLETFGGCERTRGLFDLAELQQGAPRNSPFR
jgi:hypothetical protein